MSFITKPREENSPYVQLLILIGTALLGVVVFLLLCLLVLFAIYGMEMIRNPGILTVTDSKYRLALQIVLVGQSIGLFLVPAFALPLIEGRRPGAFYGLAKPKFLLAGMVILVMIVAMPFLEWVTLMNQKMIFPEFLKGIENWMRDKEDELMRTTFLLLKMDSIPELAANLFIVAFVPAVCEEFCFRAGFQRTFTRLFNHPHTAIWVSAFLFSAIHMQFYGFLPRFLLGAGFGYIYLYSRSIWYNILAHFLNNAYVICLAFYMQKNHMDITKMDSTPQFAWYAYLISFVITLLAFQIFKKHTSNIHTAS